MKTFSTILCLLAPVAFASVNAAHSATIYPTNYSFETPVLPSSPGYSIVASGGAPGSISGWTFADSAAGGSVGGLSQAGAVSGVDQNQFAFFNINGGPGNGYATITSGTVTTIAANTDYTLHVDLAGQLQPVFASGTYQINLQVGTYTFSTSVNQSDIAADTFQDFSVPLSAATIATDGLVGQAVSIQLVAGADAVSDTYNQDGFDNVRLDTVSTAPEPSTWALIGVSALVLVWRANRKRLV